MKYTESDIFAAAERRIFERLVTDVYPAGIVSIVSDTFDFWTTITKVAPALKDKIMARQPDQFGNAKVVFRPDSGDPVRIVAGYRSVKVNDLSFGSLEAAYEDPDFDEVIEHDGCFYILEQEYSDMDYGNSYPEYKVGAELPAHVVKGSIQCLWDTFGGTTTDKGYKTLDSHVGLIYGDSITLERANNILQRLKDKGFASDNVVFGVGSFTYQYVTRDTLGFAMKATYVEIDGVGREIFKDPKTDSGTKKSARGLLKVIKDENGDYKLIDQVSVEEEKTGELRTVFKDGEIIILEEIAQLRERLATYL